VPGGRVRVLVDEVGGTDVLLDELHGERRADRVAHQGDRRGLAGEDLRGRPEHRDGRALLLGDRWHRLHDRGAVDLVVGDRLPDGARAVDLDYLDVLVRLGVDADLLEPVAEQHVRDAALREGAEPEGPAVLLGPRRERVAALRLEGLVERLLGHDPHRFADVRRGHLRGDVAVDDDHRRHDPEHGDVDVAAADRLHDRRAVGELSAGDLGVDPEK